AESIQGVGGCVVFPDGYLKHAYEIVRAHGGVCIADEVQAAFGRTGSHYWGFETQGVIPDIVTMAKGFGNGCPLAAVVTTPKIAQTTVRSEEHTSELQSPDHLVCRLLLEKKNTNKQNICK